MPIDRNLPSQQAFSADELALMKQAFDAVRTAHAGSIGRGSQLRLTKQNGGRSRCHLI